MEKENLLRLFPDRIGISQNGALELAHHSLSDLAGKWGSPLYIYDGETFFNQVNAIQALIKKTYPGPSEVSYAGKAYLSLAFARKAFKAGLNLDAVSLAEMMIAQKAGFSPIRVHLHGNNKSHQEIQFAMRWGIDNIVVDCLEELEVLEDIAQDLQQKAQIWLRIMPGVDVDTHPYVQTGHITSKFGIPIEDGQASQAIQRARNSQRLHLSGLHAHIGSQIFQTEPFIKAMRMLIDLAERENFTPEQLSSGGGWGVPYVIDQQEMNVPSLIRSLSSLLVSESTRLGWPIPKLVVEPGRWLIARAGLAVYSIGTIKQTVDGTRIVAVDGGMSDNPRPALYKSPYSACLVNEPLKAGIFPSALVGRFCESGDQLIPQILLPEVRRGDLIVLPVSGAYQLCMSSNYNLVPRPAVLWLDENVELLQPREKLEDMNWWLGEQL